MKELLANMKLKYVLVLGILLFLVSFLLLYIMFTDGKGEHNYIVSRERSQDHYVEDIPEEFPVELMEEGMADRLTELDDGSMHDFIVDRVVPPVINAVQSAEKQELPFIMWWTPFAGDQPRIKECWEGKCLFLQDKPFYNHKLTKAFLFYGTDFDDKNLPLPRKAHHEWGLFHEESPKNQALFYHKEVLELFNHTATFKQQSSYPLSTQYVKSATYILQPLKYTVAEKNRLKTEKQLSSVVYIQTGCNPPSDRDAYIQELMKYIKIDSYGNCLHNRDLPKPYQNPMKMHSKGFTDILKQYKFMISFENGICDDYMTEKLFRTFSVGAVPIYKGAPNIKEWLPHSPSAIIVDDFKSVKELADYINFLDSNDEEYDEFLNFKRVGITNEKLNRTLNERKWGVETLYQMNFVTGFECHVCDRIHQNKNLIKLGRKPLDHMANVNHYGCPAPKKYDLPSIPGSEDWERDTWLWEYEDSKRRAVDVKEKVMKSSSNS